MNWMQKLFGKAAGTVRDAAVRAFRFAPKWMRHAFLPVSWARLVDGYHKNSAVAACVTTLAFSFPEPPLLGGYEVDGRFVADYSHDIMKLIRKPNPDMGEVELMQFVITYAAVGGNLYLWKERAQNRKVLHLWPFSDAQIRPVPGGTTAEGFVKEYEFDDGQGPAIPISKDDIIHWKWMPDPDQPWRGIGAVEFSIKDSDRDSEATSYIYSLLKNNAVPPLVITLNEGDDYDEVKADRLRAQWRAKMGGENAGNVAFIEHGMKAEKMGFNLDELAAEALNAVPEARIAAAFRVPPVVAGLSVGLKRSDYGDQAARRSFTELTLAALWRSFASELRNGLQDDFQLADNFVLQFDMRKVRALLEEETKIWERVTLAFDRGAITRRMMKEMLGLVPDSGDDVYKVSLATEFVPASVGVVMRDSGAPKQLTGPTPSPSPNSKSEFGEGSKSRAVASVLRRIRVDVATRMKAALDIYFKQLADLIVERAGKGAISSQLSAKAELPIASALMDGDDRKMLEVLIKRFYVEVIQLSWDTWNVSLGIEKAFDLTDPVVTKILRTAATRVKEIESTTMEAIRDVLKYGNEHGWSIEQLVRGDENQPGLRAVVDETYKNRARVIARTELGEAQNGAAVERYKEAKVTLVEILDNGSDDDDEECKTANGQIWTLKYFDEHRLEHPNCTRAAAPVFDDVKPERG